MHIPDLCILRLLIALIETCSTGPIPLPLPLVLRGLEVKSIDWFLAQVAPQKPTQPARLSHVNIRTSLWEEQTPGEYSHSSSTNF